MALFQPYQRVNRAKVPSYVQAEIAQARADQAAKSAENSAKSMNMLGGATIYNQGMNAAGKSPISDFISESFNGGMTGTPTSTNAMAAPDSIQQSTELMDAGLYDPSVNPGAMGPVDPVMGADPLTGAMEANSAIPQGVNPVSPDMGITGTPPLGDPLTSSIVDPTASLATEALGAEAIGAEAIGAEAIGAEALGADLAGTIGADVGATAALEGAMASNAAAGTAAGTAGTAGAAGAAGGGAMSGALAALGPLGAIAALAALFG